MTHNQLILKHLKRKGITAIDALNLYGCFRLSARIFDLKNQGHNIKVTMIEKNNKMFAKYSLIK